MYGVIKAFVEKNGEVFEAAADAVAYAAGPGPGDPAAVTAACTERYPPAASSAAQLKYAEHLRTVPTVLTRH